MTIQQTVVALFQEKRIDKAVAYRLLAECKKGTAEAEPTELRLSCRLEPVPGPHPPDEPEREPVVAPLRGRDAVEGEPRADDLAERLDPGIAREPED